MLQIYGKCLDAPFNRFRSSGDAEIESVWWRGQGTDGLDGLVAWNVGESDGEEVERL